MSRMSRSSLCRAALLAVIAAATVLPTAAPADVVTDWNQTTITTGGPGITRTLSMVHIAMFDAVNALDPRFESYAPTPDAPFGASAEAAAAAAAHGVLTRRFPASAAALAAALDASLASIPDGPAETDGIAFGDAVAAGIFTLRSTDGMLAPNPAYTPGDRPGDYQLTPPGFAAPVNVGAAQWVPFAMTHPAQFRSDGPARLRSPRYRLDFEEVWSLGAADSAVRTADETLIANWHTEPAPFQLNRAARNLVGASGLDLLERTRLFALLNIALQDAGQSVFEAKYFYEFWRPVTAIRAADTDFNEGTLADPSWTPLLVTPPHPEYPAAHATVGGAGVAVLGHILGDDVAFTLTSTGVPGVTREFASFKAWEADCQVARIYGGIHFRTSLKEGGQQGRRLARFLLRNYLQPLE